jgi:hypothetical protein
MSYQKLNKATDESTGMIIDHGLGDYTDHDEVVQDSHRPKKRITTFLFNHVSVWSYGNDQKLQ